MYYLSLIDQFDPQTSPQKRIAGLDSNKMLSSTFCLLKYEKNSEYHIWTYRDLESLIVRSPGRKSKTRH